MNAELSAFAAGYGASLPGFSELSNEGRAWLLQQLRPLALPSGRILFREEDPGDALYVLVAGSLCAFRQGVDRPLVLGHVSPGETVGEAALFTGAVRSATVYACRDSELLMLDRPAFEALAQREPAATLALARHAFRRHSRLAGDNALHAGPRTIALLAGSEGVDLGSLATGLALAFGSLSSTAVVRYAEGARMTTGELHALEQTHRRVLYVDEPGHRTWRTLCKRQADVWLHAVRADHAPDPHTRDPQTLDSSPVPRIEHLLLDARAGNGATAAWSHWFGGMLSHQLRSPSDLPRIARMVAGHGRGLVLAGGGARGFAHVGVVRALAEFDALPDVVAGTSIGAVVAALMARDVPLDEVLRVMKYAFVTRRPLSGWTLPLYSVNSGRRVSALLREVFGEQRIEELALPFFCISANLTDNLVHVHRQGSVWRALRASVAIPGVLPPVIEGGKVFVDGAVLDNLPVGVMRQWPVDETIAVDVGAEHGITAMADETELPPWWALLPDLFRKRTRPGIVQLLLRAGTVGATAASQRASASADLLIAPPLRDIDLLDWHAHERAMETGYRHACEVLARRAALPRDVNTAH